MKALLLSAGLGTRLRPVTNNIPKCLVDINGRPLLDYWVSMLCADGVRPLLVNLHYMADKVLDYIETSGCKKFIETVSESELLGTAGTLLKNRDFFGEEPLMLVHADNLSKFDVRAFISAHTNRPTGCEMTMMTFTTTSPESCGIVDVDERNVVVGFYEKVKNPPGNLANGAVYILEPSIFVFLESLKKNVIDFSTEVLPRYIGRIATFHNGVYHRDIGTLESLLTARDEFPLVENPNPRTVGRCL